MSFVLQVSPISIRASSWDGGKSFSRPAEVPAAGAQVGIVDGDVGIQLGVPILWTAGWVTSVDSARDMWMSVGLEDVEVFETEPLFT